VNEGRFPEKLLFLSMFVGLGALKREYADDDSFEGSALLLLLAISNLCVCCVCVCVCVCMRE
jgi:hypothetical protein